MAIRSGRELIRIERVQQWFENANNETFMSVILKGGHPAFRATHDRVATLGEPLTIRLLNFNPFRIEGEAISQVDPGCPNKISIGTRDSEAGIKPVELNAHPVGWSLS